MEDLSKCRKEIDILDQKIVELIAKRFEIVKKVGIIKNQNKMPTKNPKRWEEVLKNIKQTANKNDLDENFIEGIYDLIHEHALKIEEHVWSL